MAQVHLHVPSFNAGELSPLLGARFAVEKVQAGCRLLRNFIPHVHGPAFRRPGMEYIGPSAGSGAKSSLRGFNFSTTTGFILEFHSSGLKVWSNGQQVPLRSPVTLPYTETECAEVQLAQVNDVCYLAHPNHRPMKLVRWADDDWRLGEIPWKWPALGDENTRSDEIATPAVSLLGQLPTYEWPEFMMTKGDDYAFSVGDLGPSILDLTSKVKHVKLWRWVVNIHDPNKGIWDLKKTISWTGVRPATIHGTADGKAGVLTPWRITYVEPISIGGAAVVEWGAQTATLALATASRESLTSTTIPVGEWQMTVECGESIPAGAKLDVQRNSPGGWKDYLTLELKPGQTLITRGETLTAAKELRFVWDNTYNYKPHPHENKRLATEHGRAMYKDSGSPGLMRFESIVFPVSTDVTLSINSTNGTGRTLTASEPIFKTGHVGSYWEISHQRDAGDVEVIGDGPSIGGGDHTLTAAESDSIRVSGTWEVFSYGIWDATFYLERKVSGVWEVARSWTSREDRNVVANGTEPNEVEMRVRVAAGTWKASDIADKPRFVLEASDARVTGLVKITAVGTLGTDGKTATATVDVVTTLYSTDATSFWTEGAWSGVQGYPRTVGLHGQRLWFGGTTTAPIRIWGSVVNDYENFRRTSLDDASVSFTPSAQQSNRLQWMQSHGGNLVLGTNGDEWTVAGGTDSGPITPTSVDIKRRSGYGSQYLPAVLMGEVIAFVQRGGHKVREVAPRDAVGLDWQAADLTVLSEHIALSGITQTAAMFFPQSILWAVTNDGKLLGMTFEQEQNVFAWHVHETDGLVESVAVVFGAASDEVWLAVNRNGKRSIERLDLYVMARAFTDQTRLMYLDAAVRVEFLTPTDTITGLSHLEGRQVGILGDGSEMAPAAVVNGTVSLDRPVSVAIVGLQFTSQLQPMRIEIPLRDGTAQHRGWKIARAALDLHNSLGGEVADGPDGKFEKLNYRRTNTPMDSAPPLYSAELETALEARTRAGADVVIRTSGPLPLNIVSLTLKGDVYGE